MLLYILSFVILYISVLFLDLVAFLIYEENLSGFFILSNFIAPLAPSLLTLLLGTFLGKLIKSKDKK